MFYRESDGERKTLMRKELDRFSECCKSLSNKRITIKRKELKAIEFVLAGRLEPARDATPQGRCCRATATRLFDLRCAWLCFLNRRKRPAFFVQVSG